MSFDSIQTLSHYRLVEKIGEGGMGVVWKAEDTVLHRTVAIKVLSADSALDEKRRQMFLEEARLASSVSDARIAQVFELGREGSLDFIVMEYVEGKPLSQILHGRPLPAEKVASLGEQVARALSRTHRKGLLHRDLKPANILVTPEGEVKVVDFGLATLYSQSESSLSTRPADRPTPTTPHGPAERHGFAGTLAYMSPEQARSETLDPRSDIFSLGAVLYEMTSGQRPFSGASRSETLREILRARPVPVHERVPKVPLDLDRIITKALAPQRDERYQTMEDLAVDLKRLGRELESGVSHSYEEVLEPAARFRRRRAALGLGVAALAAAAGLWWIARGMPQWPGWAGSAGKSTLLILPLEVRGQREGAEYVGRAFAEGLAADLAPAGNLKVLPVPAQGLRDPADPLAPARAARAVGAGRLLLGSLTRQGKSIQVRLSLVDSLENRVLWGSQRDSSDDQMPVLASDLAREAAEQLRAVFPKLYDMPDLAGGGPEMAASPLTTDSLSALRRHDVAAGLEATRKLVEAFPREPDAYALRTDALMKAYEREASPENRKAIDEGIAALRRVDPRHFYCDAKPAYLLGREGHPREAIERLTRILERNDLTPAVRAYVLGLRGQAERVAGELDAALADLEEALRLNPTSASTFQKLGETLRSAGRNDDALVRTRQAAALSPENPLIQYTLSLVLANVGKNDEALGASRQACELSANQSLCAGYAIALAHAGRKAEAQAAAGRAGELTPESDGMYNLACYMALSGRKSEAIRLLRRAVELGDVDSYLTRDPDLTSLHGDPGFEAIAADVTGRLKPR